MSINHKEKCRKQEVGAEGTCLHAMYSGWMDGVKLLQHLLL